MIFTDSCNANRCVPSGLPCIVAASALASPFSSRNLCTCKLANYLLLHVSHRHKSSPFFYLFIKLPVNCMFSLTAGQTLWSPRCWCDSWEGRRGAAEANALLRRRHRGHAGGTYATAVCMAVMTAWCRSGFFFFSAHSFPIHDHIGRITDVLNQPERRQNSLECIKRWKAAMND